MYAFWKYQLAKPTATNLNPIYTGDTNNPLHPTYSNVNTTYMDSGGTQSAVNAGDYTATFSLKDSTKTEWADQSTAAVSINWSVQPINISSGITVTLPQSSYTYDGTAKQPDPTVTI